jgi:hypothetical protein
LIILSFEADIHHFVSKSMMSVRKKLFWGCQMLKIFVYDGCAKNLFCKCWVCGKNVELLNIFETFLKQQKVYNFSKIELETDIRAQKKSTTTFNLGLATKMFLAAYSAWTTIAFSRQTSKARAK